MRSQHRVKMHLATQRFMQDVDFRVHQEHRPMRIGKYLFDDSIATGALGIG